jgi:hypothetical protein
MTRFCDDRDLLCLEPALFDLATRPSRRRCGGADGQLDGTTFSSAGAHFTSTHVEAGMVLAVQAGAERAALEIVSVDSQTALTVSLPRPSADEDPIPPDLGENLTLTYSVVTFAALIERVSDSLAERMRLAVEIADMSPGDFADSQQLRQAVAHGTLGAIFVGRAEDADDRDANWAKARHYREEYRRLVLQLRLSVDADGDGQAEQTRTLGHISLRRI